MDRRQFAAAVLGAGASLSGCLSAPTRDGQPAPSGARRPQPPTLGDVTLPIRRDEMRQALPQDSIAAITDPAFASDWSSVKGPADGAPLQFEEGEPVIGVVRDGAARAYPLRVLNRHEVVNDDVRGPLLVTYCPLCGSSIVAERRVRGRETVFGVSGLLWRGDLVMYDRASRSLWSQLLATAVNGPMTGERLRLYPSSLTSLGEWRREHPDTAVLLPPPHSGLIGNAEPRPGAYGSSYEWDGGQLIGYDGGGSRDLSRTTLVVGVVHDGEATAYPYPEVQAAGIVNDHVGGRPVLVTTTPGGTLAAYWRRIDGQVLAFEPVDERRVRGDGSLWERATGRAVSGSYEGTRLAAANDQPPMFWTGWSSFYPGTRVYGAG